MLKLRTFIDLWRQSSTNPCPPQPAPPPDQTWSISFHALLPFNVGSIGPCVRMCVCACVCCYTFVMVVSLFLQSTAWVRVTASLHAWAQLLLQPMGSALLNPPPCAHTSAAFNELDWFFPPPTLCRRYIIWEIKQTRNSKIGFVLIKFNLI